MFCECPYYSLIFFGILTLTMKYFFKSELGINVPIHSFLNYLLS